jgi:hypothetical protein
MKHYTKGRCVRTNIICNCMVSSHPKYLLEEHYHGSSSPTLRRLSRTRVIWLRVGAAHKTILGGAIAQAVSRWLPTAAARVRARVRSRGICGGQSSTEEGFVRPPVPSLYVQYKILNLENCEECRSQNHYRSAGDMDQQLLPEAKQYSLHSD